MNHDRLKTLGPQAARLVTELYERGKTLFSHADVQDITGLQPKSARNFVASLVQRGIVTRLKPGMFILVPFELGRGRCVVSRTDTFAAQQPLAADGGRCDPEPAAAEAAR